MKKNVARRNLGSGRSASISYGIPDAETARHLSLLAVNDHRGEATEVKLQIDLSRPDAFRIEIEILASLENDLAAVNDNEETADVR